jgi:hypothetical protein
MEPLCNPRANHFSRQTLSQSYKHQHQNIKSPIGTSNGVLDFLHQVLSHLAYTQPSISLQKAPTYLEYGKLGHWRLINDPLILGHMITLNKFLTCAPHTCALGDLASILVAKIPKKLNLPMWVLVHPSCVSPNLWLCNIQLQNTQLVFLVRLS